jgi:hypothetical protein
MMGEIIRLRNGVGADECNARGHSFHVSKWGTFLVPAEDLEPLMRVGGFSIAREDDASAVHAELNDVREAAWHLPLGPTRDAILNFINQL